MLHCLLVPLLPRYAKVLNLNQSQIGVLFGSYAVVLRVATFLLARISSGHLVMVPYAGPPPQ